MITAAMSYCLEESQELKYIANAPLVNNNGIFFNYSDGLKASTKVLFEEKVINALHEYLSNQGKDIYEPQYQTMLKNWLIFFRNRYMVIVRYTQILRSYRLTDLLAFWDGMDIKKNNIKKCYKNRTRSEGLLPDLFYEKVSKKFEKQCLSVSFSYGLWMNLKHSIPYMG